MKKRDVAFLLIGLGAGVLSMEVAIAAFLSHTFVFGVEHRADLVVFGSPLVLIGCGAVILYRGRSSN